MDDALTPEQQRRNEWAREVREKIEEAWRQSQRAEMLDGEAVFRHLRQLLEDRHRSLGE
jgi:hypothetical protein